ncbi:hypothetical protein ACFVTY_09115 [Streptomyces sp. NPDC058067]
MGAMKPDLRREAGQRRRDSLLAAALGLIAQRGREGVTLRDSPKPHAASA